MADTLLKTLDQAEDEIREQNHHIQHEKQMIEEADAEGHDSGTMRKSLKAMYHFRDALKHHRRILLERLGLYRA
jgi:hypothetical protein